MRTRGVPPAAARAKRLTPEEMARILLTHPNPDMERLLREWGHDTTLLDPTTGIEQQLLAVDVVLPDCNTALGRRVAQLVRELHSNDGRHGVSPR